MSRRALDAIGTDVHDLGMVANILFSTTLRQTIGFWIYVDDFVNSLGIIRGKKTADGL